MADDFDKYLPQDAGPTTADKQKPIGPDNPLRIGIVGHNYVGKAIEYAFTHPLIDLHIVDPDYDTTVDDMIDFNPMCVFICTPTEVNEKTGFVDASVVEDSALKLIEHTEALTVVTSTVTPDIIDRLYNSMFEDGVHRLVYNPQFLTENNTEEQFVNAEYHIIGGTERATAELAEIYEVFSLCKARDYYRMSGCEASFVKYAVNSFLATKLTFFNQLYDLVNSYFCSYNMVVNAVGRDPRIGIGHTRVPGYDRKRGYSGERLPRDLDAFLKFSEGKDKDGNKISFDLLEKVAEVNERYRKLYQVNTSNGEENERNGQTEEELEGQDNRGTGGQ